jgi:HEXXH motif-containing protein
VRRHALSDRAFAELGAGRPSLETVTELRRAQLSRHLLLLRSLRLSSGYASLHALEHENRAAFRRFVEDPLTGAWAAAELRAGRGESVIELPQGMSRR